MPQNGMNAVNARAAKERVFDDILISITPKMDDL
jgi:hypothetical protein